ncbi:MULTISPECIES: polysaccharide biosynthesis tyrosine autokinase [Mycolicibacter]|uniref:AAA family ATPase n=1 Tax=[Mycobacterium] vasticus TaxID=2875777 RepID=A0ABU5YRQ3_9MYCO|nr:MULTISPECIES: polysaccharide biosynthesis tyrosine autokinase [unclassified Mycolicibacter]MEB3061527.1 AAA family ATPase [Mycolicibacter sp. MYC101]MEB3067794.1 AAA family ATPase [Mycolicibacter sp. MYC017]
MDFRTFVQVLRQHWKVVVGALLGCLLGAGAVTALQTKSYESTATILISFTGETNLNDTYYGTEAAQERLSSYAVIAAGHTVAQRAVDQLHLPMNADALAAATSVAFAPRSAILTLTVLDTQPERAAALAGAMADQFAAMVPTLGTGPRPHGLPQQPPPAPAPVQEGQDVMPVANETPIPAPQPADLALQQSLPRAMATIVERPGVPGFPVKPVPARNMAIGLIAGAVLGVGAALTRNAADRTIRDRETLEEISGVPTLAELAVDHGRHAPRFGTNGAFDDAMRTLRHRLLRAIGPGARRILVTAPFGGEGTTTTALNLALAFSELGEKVLLVEGNVLHPTIAGILNVTSGDGLTGVLGDLELSRKAIRSTSVPNLFVLAARTARPGTLPCSAFSHDAVENLLRDLATRHDRVIIDGPPPLATADARLFAGAVEATVLVARLGRTTVDEVNDGLYALRPSVVSGTVLTHAKVSRHARAAIRAYRRKSQPAKATAAK